MSASARTRGAICAALLVFLLAPSAALGKGGQFVTDAPRYAEFHLKASNGFRLSVFASRGTVYLTASHGDEQVTYETAGHTARGRIRARFGEVGSIAVRFHPSGRPRHVPLPDGNCRGRGHIETKGAFVGSIVFEGEQLYASRRATRARGREVHAFKQVCHGVKEDSQVDRSLRIASLIAESDSEVGELESRFLVLFAFRITSQVHRAWNSSTFSATLIEDSSRLSIERTESVDAGLQAFGIEKTSDGTVTATLAPPAPFTGTATYRKEKGARASWGGDLSVPFLGVGVVPLIGVGWSSQLSEF